LAIFWINKNTLCNGCILTGWSVFNSKSSCIQPMIKSKTVTDHKRCPWRVLAKSKTKTAGSCATVRTGLWRCLVTPQCLADNDEDVRMSEQHRPDARSISIQPGVGYLKSTLSGKSLQAVRTSWQHVRTMSSILEYSRVSFECGKEFIEDRPDVNLIKIELRCFWKDIVENRLDEANFHPDARQPELESQ
jgi:hypothetical protein